MERHDYLMVLFVIIFGACLLYSGTFLIIFGIKRFVFGIKFILLDAFVSIVRCLFCCILCLIYQIHFFISTSNLCHSQSSKTRETRK